MTAMNTISVPEPVSDQPQSYADWLANATEQDARHGKIRWRENDASEYYDHRSIRDRLERIRALRAAGDDHGLLFALNEGIHGNMDGIASPHLWRQAASGTKYLISEYMEAIAEAIQHLASPKVDTIPDEEKIDFFRRALHCYGCSALLLSGSGAFLYFHMGVVRAMAEQGLLPNIIAGSSGGSIVGAVVCTHRDADLSVLLSAEEMIRLAEGDDMQELPGSLSGVTQRLKQEEIAKMLERIIPDLTFQEAFELTGRHLNVSVAPSERHQNGRLLNAITSPNVFIREAVLASCAVPGVYAPVQLMAKDAKGKRVPYLPGRRWVDGSMTHDLPTKRLSRLYGVNHHIVSQANPLARPFASETKQAGTRFGALRAASMTTTKAWLNAQMTLFDLPLSLFPPLHRLATTTMSVINQEYLGDINIIRPIMLWSPSKLLSALSLEEMQQLISTGEAMTWPKIEMIRTQTMISRTLSDALQVYDTGTPASAVTSTHRIPA